MLKVISFDRYHANTYTAVVILLGRQVVDKIDESKGRPADSMNNDGIDKVMSGAARLTWMLGLGRVKAPTAERLSSSHWSLIHQVRSWTTTKQDRTQPDAMARTRRRRGGRRRCRRQNQPAAAADVAVTRRRFIFAAARR